MIIRDRLVNLDELNGFEPDEHLREVCISVMLDLEDNQTNGYFEEVHNEKAAVELVVELYSLSQRIKAGYHQ